ncbi:MAG: hypothetical protein ACP5SE_03605 [Nitrososphaeria archaeon]
MNGEGSRGLRGYSLLQSIKTFLAQDGIIAFMETIHTSCDLMLVTGTYYI